MASRQYSIWNAVQACIYSGNKSWGAKDVCEVTVNVGSGSRNSHELVTHTTKKIETDDEIMFKFYVDGIKVKEMIFENNKGRAGKLLQSWNYLVV